VKEEISVTIPVYGRAHWRAAAWFWGGFALISYIQGTLWLWLTETPMPLTDTLHWLVRWLLWWGGSPLLIQMAQRYPIQASTRPFRWLPPLLLHLSFVTVVSALITALEYGLMYPLERWLAGTASTPAEAVSWFLSRYSTFVAIYMLIVAGYQFMITSAQNQHLREETLRVQLKTHQIQAQLEQAQLQALRMQLNPHFLFNTHHAIIGLIMSGEQANAIRMLRALSDLLRTIVDGEEEHTVSLQREFTVMRSYLQIQQIRYQDRLHVRIDADPVALQSQVPSLILQPLIENAFVHGLERVAGPATLCVRATAQEDRLIVRIEDNGAGLPATPPATGVGLRNTRRRLNQLYGQNATLRLTPTPGGGTTCLLEMPLYLTPAIHNFHAMDGPDRR
jgi:sensor histidine kinase YesM